MKTWCFKHWHHTIEVICLEEVEEKGSVFLVISMIALTLQYLCVGIDRNCDNFKQAENMVCQNILYVLLHFINGDWNQATNLPKLVFLVVLVNWSFGFLSSLMKWSGHELFVWQNIGTLIFFSAKMINFVKYYLGRCNWRKNATLLLHVWLRQKTFTSRLINVPERRL